jgi:glutaredoxin
MQKRALLYRMVTDEHICPFGLKSRDFLERKNFHVEDFKLRSRHETDDFKAIHKVKTTPQTFIDGQRIGGYDDLRAYFGMEAPASDDVTYAPVIAIFLTALLMSIAIVWQFNAVFSAVAVAEIFVAISMCILAIQKLQDLTSFSNQFLTYDLLARKIVRYAYVYPFAEVFAGLGMLAGLSAWLVSPVALFIGCVGAASVIKAVYMDKRELKCACVGGNSNVPLGFISLDEQQADCKIQQRLEKILLAFQ